MEGIFYYFRFCDFYSRRELESFSALGSWVARLERLNVACCNPIRTVTVKPDTVNSDSPSSPYSFCIYGVLGFFSACSPGLVYLRPSNPAVPE